jgi:putative nucleotidyltransferase with HDIG domain
MKAIDALIQGIDSLQPIPAIFNQIMNILEDPRTSLEDVANVIMFDPSITANLLRKCNSAYYNLPRQVDSVQEAITYLGMDQVIDLVLINASAQNFRCDQKGYGLHEGELWRSAVSSALVAREIAAKIETEHPHIVFTGALLKDIGKVVLDRFVSKTFEKIMCEVQENKLSFREAEKKIIGIDHAELGALLTRKWGFSSKMVNIIRHHHLDDESQRENVDICIVYLADAVCMMMGIGVGQDGLAYRFHSDVLRKFNITAVDLQEIIAGFGEKIHQVEDLISLT